MGFVVCLMALQPIPDALPDAAVGVERVQQRLVIQFPGGVLRGVVVAEGVVRAVLPPRDGVVVHAPHEVGLPVDVQLAAGDGDIRRVLLGLAVEVDLQMGWRGRTTGGGGMGWV